MSARVCVPLALATTTMRNVATVGAWNVANTPPMGFNTWYVARSIGPPSELIVTMDHDVDIHMECTIVVLCNSGICRTSMATPSHSYTMLCEMVVDHSVRAQPFTPVARHVTTTVT